MWGKKHATVCKCPSQASGPAADGSHSSNVSSILKVLAADPATAKVSCHYAELSTTMVVSMTDTLTIRHAYARRAFHHCNAK